VVVGSSEFINSFSLGIDREEVSAEDILKLWPN